MNKCNSSIAQMLGKESWELLVFLSLNRKKATCLCFLNMHKKISVSPSGISATIYMNTGLPMRQVLKEISGTYWGILIELQTWSKAAHTREESAPSPAGFYNTENQAWCSLK